MDNGIKGTLTLPVIQPSKSEVVNLLTPSTPSASHIGMSSLRMEPQFMVRGDDPTRDELRFLLTHG